MGAFLAVSAASSAALLALALRLGAWYLVGCAACLLWLSCARLAAATFGREAAVPDRRELAWSAALAPPGVALVALSAAQALLRLPEPPADPIALVSAALVAALVALVCARSLTERRRDASLGAWVARRVDVCLLASALATVVVQLLTLGDASEWAAMTCLTGCILGSLVLLVALSIASCALCSSHTVAECAAALGGAVRRRRRAIHLAAVGKDALMVAGKGVLAVASTSPFVLASSAFSCGIAVARFTALRMEGKDSVYRFALLRRMGVVLAASGLAYALYSARFFFGERSAGGFGEVLGLAIATLTFADFAVQVAALVRLRGSHDLEAWALRMVGLAAILVNFPLTQSALMSFSEASDHAFFDGLSGAVFGGLVVMVGLTVLVRGVRGGRQPLRAQR